MPSRSTLARLLADRIDRLQATFAALNSAVRDKVAEVVGKTVEDLVRNTVRIVLERATTGPDYRKESEDGWWDDDEPNDRRRRTYNDDDSWSRPASVQPTPSRPRFATAFLAGCRTAGWWLSRTTREAKTWTWAVAGLVAGVAVYAFPPLAAALLPAAAALTLADGAVDLTAAWPD
jgi:hypothetical protein